MIDDDGVLRVVVAHDDPGVANWLDTAGHSAGPVILRCVRTESAPVPDHPRGQVRRRGGGAAVRDAPGQPRRNDSAAIAARRLAVSKRFCR